MRKLSITKELKRVPSGYNPAAVRYFEQWA